MHRLVAILAGAALVLIAGLIPTLHTHVYMDHDHPEHHHGLSVHEHYQPAPHPDHDGPRVEPCDPSQHAASFVLGCTPGAKIHANDAASVCPRIDEPPASHRSTRDVTDVRVHGPPPRTHAPSRAPPLTFPA